MIREDRVIIKFRIVFDVVVKYKGKSLNDIIRLGLNFRESW